MSTRVRARGPTRRARVWTVTAALTLLFTAVPMAAAGADGPILVTYSWTELTEGITVDKVGNIFVSHSPAGELWKIAPGAAAPEVFGAVGGIDAAAGDLGLIGLAVDGPGNVYSTVVSFTNPNANGVWAFDRRTGEATKAPGSEAIVLANAIAFDKRGNLYVTDSVAGAVWRIPSGGPAAPWLVDETLAGTGILGLGLPIGANGIAYRQGALYVSNTEQGSIVKVPILPNGDAGTPSVVIQDDAIFGIDGIALDVHGDVYAAIIAQSAVRKISLGPNPTVESLGEGGPGSPVLDPSSLAFGTGKGKRSTLYVVNFGIFSQAVFGDVARPAVLEFDVGVPGMPLP